MVTNPSALECVANPRIGRAIGKSDSHAMRPRQFAVPDWAMSPPSGPRRMARGPAYGDEAV